LIGGFQELIRNQVFCKVLVISGLVFGSHAMHDTFAVIRWHSAGLSPTTSSILWSEAVAAEVAVFLFLGPFLIKRYGAKGAAILAASAGAVRWVVMSQTTDVAVLAIIQPLHGFTFALLHLACMGVIGASVPSRLAATAQSIYAFGGGIASAFLSYLSGILYGEFGALAFLIMAVLCLIAIPIAFSVARVQSVQSG
jgi:PPP family 3-phenylpropionic acid transporter